MKVHIFRKAPKQYSDCENYVLSDFPIFFFQKLILEFFQKKLQITLYKFFLVSS